MIGTRIGQYEILDKIGEGGMGEVYKARDHRLDREVAIKFMAERSQENTEAHQRFEREARAVAALSHPNILAIHDYGEHEGLPFAVTELLKGQSLSERLSEGPVPARSALDLAAQAADGLAAAHDRGIVHRDIKPANLFLLPDGRLVILDFGLAKANGMSNQDDRTQVLEEGTTPGTVLGTVRYMSPEQVRGMNADARSDLFSLGVVLWELFSGESAFKHDSAIESMNAILHEDPPSLSGREPAVAPALVRIVERCMAKAPEQRFQSARDLAFALRNADSNSSSSQSHASLAAPLDKTKSKGRFAWWLALPLGLVLGALAFSLLPQPEPAPPVQVRTITHTGRDDSPSASPDGSMIAFVSSRDGVRKIWLRLVKGGTEQPLTEGPDDFPRFSPDGTSVLFLRGAFGEGSAWRVPVVGGAPRAIIEQVADVAWAPDGDRIAFLRPIGGGSIPQAVLGIHDLRTGQEREIRRTENLLHIGLQWSPDGRYLAMSTSGATQNNGINSLDIVEVSTGEARQVRVWNERIGSPVWSPDSKSLIVARAATLLGDLSNPLGMVYRVNLDNNRDEPLFWVQSVWAGSNDFATFDRLGQHDLIFDEILWRGSLFEFELDPKGIVGPAKLLTSGNARDRQPVYSPDGQQVLFSSNRNGNLDLWLLNRETGVVRQLTDDPAEDWDPAFSPDGRTVLWSSSRSGNLEIWAANLDGSGARQVSENGQDAENPTMTPDGEWIVFGSGSTLASGIFRMRKDGSDVQLLQTGSYFVPELSPDGQYVASGISYPEKQMNVLVVFDAQSGEIVSEMPLRGGGLRATITSGRARWMPDGKSLVFVYAGEEDHAVLVQQDFVPGVDTSSSRRTLLALGDKLDIESFAISRDGKKLVVSRMEHFRSLKVARGVFGGK